MSPAIEYLLAFSLTLVLIVLLVPVARRIGLIDVPGERKSHHQPTPLVGGVAIYLALTLMALATGLSVGEGGWFLAGCGLLVAVGVVDDFRHLPVSLRVVVEVIAATLMVFGGGVAVFTVGDLLGTGVLSFPLWIAYPFSAIAVFGVINALNMLDGLDGLCAGVSFASLAVLFSVASDDIAIAGFGQLLMPCLVAFVLCNCALLPGLPKVFLGDAGSKLIGFALVWLLIEVAQPQYAGSAAIPPVAALYLIGLPLMDMVATTINRVRRGHWPFDPDRTHLHHVFMDCLGYSPRAAVRLMVSLALTVNLLGVALMRLSVPDVVQFALFFALFFGLVAFKHINLSRHLSAAAQ